MKKILVVGAGKKQKRLLDKQFLNELNTKLVFIDWFNAMLFLLKDWATTKEIRICAINLSSRPKVNGVPIPISLAKSVVDEFGRSKIMVGFSYETLSLIKFERPKQYLQYFDIICRGQEMNKEIQKGFSWIN